MIGYLKGKVKYFNSEYVLFEVNGVGYEIMCSGAAFSKLSGLKPNEEGEVYTCMQVKEDGISLFGFGDPQEKALFLKLTSVQGVGARMGIAILSSMRPNEVTEAIALADVKRLSAVKGVGKRTADRIILELHGKITADELLNASDSAAPKKSAPSVEEAEAVSALMGLGFTRQESVQAVERAKKTGAVTVEEMIAAALRGI